MLRTSRRLFPALLSITNATVFALLLTSPGRGLPSLAPTDGDGVGAVARQPETLSRPATAAFDARKVALGLTLVENGFSSPVLVTSPRDGSGRLFVVEQTGRIKIIRTAPPWRRRSSTSGA